MDLHNLLFCVASVEPSSRKRATAIAAGMVATWPPSSDQLADERCVGACQALTWPGDGISSGYLR